MQKIDEFKNMVDEIKFENLDLFSKIEKTSKFCEQTFKPIKENELKLELRPTPPPINNKLKFYWCKKFH